MKILIMGYSGAGKSTLAKELGKRYDCPVLHLDTVYFQENWVEREAAKAEDQVSRFLDEHADWVIDGNYRKRFAFQRRCREADRIIQLLLPRRVCLWRVMKRYFQNRGTVRDSMAAGCVEKLDWEFVRWILWEGRTAEVQESFRHIQQEYADKVLVCPSAKAAAGLRLP